MIHSGPVFLKVDGRAISRTASHASCSKYLYQSRPESKKKDWEQVYKNNSNQEVSWYQDAPEKSLELINQTNLDKQVAVRIWYG